MENLDGRVAVVTGGGSGIGSGICRALAGEGVKVVVSDIDDAAAAQIADSIRGDGGTAIAVRTDVSQRADVEALARRTIAELGRVDIVCNNAGVLVGGPILETTEDDWQWLLSVNMMGVVHGSQVFAPLFLERGEGHIVNTASVGGFLSFSTLAIYCATKYAVVGYSEALHMELAPRGVGVSILCPGMVRTNLSTSDRSRPAHFGDAGGSSKELGDLSQGMEPIEVGGHVVRGIKANAPFIFTHSDFRGMFQQKFDGVLSAFGA